VSAEFPRPGAWRVLSVRPEESWINGGRTLEHARFVAEVATVAPTDAAVAQALIEAAPGHGALLREARELLGDYLNLTASVFGHVERHEGEGVCLHCANIELSARIDGAKGGG
jgi:hypothetical protein